MTSRLVDDDIHAFAAFDIIEEIHILIDHLSRGPPLAERRLNRGLSGGMVRVIAAEPMPNGQRTRKDSKSSAQKQRLSAQESRATQVGGEKKEK